ncbi:PD-(D/E)XK nuclease-like domain-containing protein [Brevibacillus porteri]|uniref:Putative exodeoxyribonuclease 8 PDDEXK-like domain-containing protein n=1 Tax=Brevibacillus porteri TaxID=2126350 RepID=A0ABX5FTY9_9BACL|nr:PD-(D/E)XK nuclease-like domain-containing protein [Brevibacillus porteri]MED1801328.1 PD-(D/E)XK nuclease-like domain-containing protein [Brevibacillus porteri]MED2135035.1 PD-(D/E)XK nuclease-like domain-containing protein [Brevibacillus porteri]MED2745132.1 PD-(D/E)XK nuclease-like domain-containing protein [Brevibacillus porteri]MED2813426.1 PD-(D/E)XK nuclease-like domain-containing protein [Brevibacillus porteri]MED2897961.1 PD-(D/E)XK nuclease-like domain-containing protein [Brevibac
MQLNKSNYYSTEANLHYMSGSQLKSFLPAYEGCEAKAMAKIRGEYVEPPKDAFDEGHYLHAWNEGTLDEFKVNNPSLYSTRAPSVGQLKSNFQHCNKMIKILESDPLVMKALAGKKEVIMTAELFGVPWKIMIDSYQPEVGIFSDLKALKDIGGKWWNKETQCYENFLDHYGYTLQMAVYAEVERLVMGRDKWLIPHIVVVTKQDLPDYEIIYFDYDVIEASLQIVKNKIERVKSIKSGLVPPVRCEKCEYCRGTKRINRIKHYSELALY